MYNLDMYLSYTAVPNRHTFVFGHFLIFVGRQSTFLQDVLWDSPKGHLLKGAFRSQIARVLVAAFMGTTYYVL